MNEIKDSTSSLSTIPGPVMNALHPSPAAELMDAVACYDALPGMRTDRVEAMRSRLAAGDMLASASQIADALLRSAKR